MITKIPSNMCKSLVKLNRPLFSRFIVNNPTTSKPCAEFPIHEGAQEMKKQLQIMNKGRAKWQQLSLPQRKELMGQFVANFEKQKEELIGIVQSSTGKHRECAELEIEMSIALLKQDLQEEYPKITTKQDGMYYFKAFGNILVVCDCRMASVSCLKYLVMCGVAGNCLILNPHRYGLPIGKRIETLWRSVLPEYPLIYCPINHFTDGLEFLIQKKDMGFISFTGDIQAGNAFYHIIAQKSDILAESEFLLTSSDTAYIMKDITHDQLPKVAHNLAFASFMGGGNLFNSVKRIYVDHQIRDKFTKLFVEAAKAYKISVPQSKASPIITSDHINEAKKSIKQFQQYKEDAMKLLSQLQTKQSYKSLYVSPIIYKVQGISSIEYWNRIYPLPVAFIEGVSSERSAIEQINSSLYGNTSVIYTNRKDKIYEIGQQLDLGVVYGNRWGFSPGVPYSPRKRSGKGMSFSKFSYPNVVKLQSLKGYHDLGQ